MKIHLYLIILLLIGSCSKKNKSFEEFEFGKQAYIKVIVTNCESPTLLEIYSRHTFPSQEFRYNKKVYQDTNFVFDLPSNLYDLSYIKIKETHLFHNYTIPGDTLIVKLNLDSNLVGYEKIKYEGSSAEICDYFIAKIKNWVVTGAYDYYYDSTQPISEYTEKLDSNQHIDLEFLNNYHQKNTLPEWFVQRERNNIIYEIAGSKLRTLRRHWLLYDSTFTSPKNNYSFLDKIQINNPEAGLSSNYYNFLASHYQRHNKLKKPSEIDPINWYNTLVYEIHKTNIVLNSRIFDILIGRYLTSYLSDRNLSFSNIEKVDSLIKIALPEMNDPELREIVSNYRDSQFQKLQKKTPLEYGEKAPEFFLSDTSDQYFKLEDFKGKVVYINFWTSYCAPCINTIPEKNKLIEEFSDYPFTLINICLDDSPDKWKGILADHKLKGINLICKGGWGNKIRDKYLIQTVPHYVLINKDGMIIKNKCDKPELINSQLFEQLK